jgi:hypothetical protein
MRQTLQYELILYICGVGWLAQAWTWSRVPLSHPQMLTSPMSAREAAVSRRSIVNRFKAFHIRD